MLSIVVYWVGWVIYTHYLHPLAKIPGPFWPSVSRTWLMYRMYKGDLEFHQRSMHHSFEYGPLVRIAPDEVHSSDPKAIPIIYRVQQPLEKTNFYLTFRPMIPGFSLDMFTDDSEKHHTAYRKIVGPVYTLTSMLKNEGALDKTANLFMERLGDFADRNESFDFGLWLEMFAFDNVGAVFFGKQFGFLEESTDYGGYINAVHTALPLNSFVAMAPFWIRPLLLNCGIVIPKIFKAVMAAAGIWETAVRETNMAQERSQDNTAKRNDILSQLLAIEQDKKSGLTIQGVHTEMWAAVTAGAESTAGALRAIFYYLMKHPETMAKLIRDVDTAFENGMLTHPVQYHQAMKLPYLNGVIREATRLFPPFGAPMPRYAPAKGLELSGYHVPAGTKVGMNASVVQYDKELFGEDAYAFRPDRWLESGDRYRAMDKAMLVFGAGTRTCIGKNLSNSEMYKLVPELLHRFSIEMAHDQPWKTRNATFVLQSNVICRFTRR
ncbi:cytochrome P450 [Dothidotthia symphoricarpi CBS 119687]|uniref:Cytochrome P450 n=1 Tax=Dothidotthia symphoricarpi CBS 119687 TaxID=1392245 RepID=A0A6A6APV5_9PLEO|nr:cytochrome P450 [Dothidotthia symphoricarpi CBS 119687]KAF2132974.1 cytochrome P450 [Dothidotthia symphoricarpi CBS 119687]